MTAVQSVRVEPVQPGDLPHLLAVCDECPLRHDVRPGTDEPWVVAAAQTFGFCGVRARVGTETVGQILISPPVHVPVHGPYASGGVSPDAAVILHLYVAPAHRHERVGRRMIERLAGLLVRRRVAGIEVRASRVGATCTAPPSDWLASRGFHVIRDDHFLLRMRMDLHSTRLWWPDLEAVQEEIRRLVGRPAPGPEPASRERPP